MITSIAILAGGLATRMQPLTVTTPKAMLEVAGRPFIHYQLELLRRQHVRQVVVCAGFLGEQIQAFIGDGRRYGLDVRYAFDGDPLLGTGGALKNAASLLGPVFFVMYGDSFLKLDFQAAGRYFLEHDRLGMMTVFQNNNQWDRSNVRFEQGSIQSYDKTQPAADMHYIDYGLGILRQQALECMGEKKIFDLAELYQKLIGSGQMLGYEVKERFYEIGSRQGLLETEKYIATLNQHTDVGRNHG